MVVGSAPAEAMLQEAADRARALGAATVRTRAVRSKPVSALENAVNELCADLLVVENVGLNSLSGRILGSVPQAAARKVKVDTSVVRTS